MALDELSERHPPPVRIPWWQIVIPLVGFPALYMLNSFAPWSRQLFGANDRTYYYPFFASILTLHWLNAALSMYFLRSSGVTLSDIDLKLSWTRILRVLRVLIIVGATFVLYREFVPYSMEHPRGLAILPTDGYQRLFFVFVAVSAGFCEEITYRGFGLAALQGRGIRLWQAIVLTSLSFTLMHGPAGVFAFPVFFLGGILYAGIYLGRVGGIGPRGVVKPPRTRSLLRAMIIHSVGDMMAILAP